MNTNGKIAYDNIVLLKSIQQQEIAFLINH